MLKVTSGIFRGRILHSVPGNGTRPTQERLRQAWFNSLQFQLPEARILDLFSGSGALGFEAISRGAGSVIFVEENPKAVKVILQNAQQLGVQAQIQILQKKVESLLSWLGNEPPFDLVLMDPPYHKGYEELLLNQWPWEKILAEDGKLCIESAFRKEGGYSAPNILQVSREERYGDSLLTFYRREL